MDNKEILASLEIADHEIRLIVGEFHNNKLNVLKVEQVEINGITDFEIRDEYQVVEAIKKAINNASKLLGVTIEKVLLLIPSVDFQKRARRVMVFSNKDRVRPDLDEVKEALKKVVSTAVEGDTELVNCVITRFIADGVMSKRFPANESMYELSIETDLLCANKSTVYEYVKCVESAGLGIIDIGLDMYAIAKESALLDQASQDYTLLIKMERASTVLSLITHGRIMSCEVLPKGYHDLIFAAMDAFELPYDIMTRLIRYNCRFNTENLQESPIYMWSINDVPKTVSEKEIVNEIKPVLMEYIEEIRLASLPVLETGKATVILCGEGAELMGIDELVGKAFSVTSRSYVPDTLGARNSALASCLGMLYTYKDFSVYRRSFINSVDIFKFEQVIQSKRKKETSIEDSVTNRFKSMFDKKAK